MKNQNETPEGQNEILKDSDDQPIDQNDQTLDHSEIPLPEINNRESTTDITNIDYHSETTKHSLSELNTSLQDENSNSNSPTGLNTPLSEESRANARPKKSDTFKWVIVKQHIISTMDKLGYGSTSVETENALETFRYYYMKYRDKTGQNHPRLNDQTMLSVMNRFITGTLEVTDTDAEAYMALIDEHFDTNYGKKIDWNIQHFMTEDVRNILYHRVK